MRIGRYRLLDVLGRGGMGIVWKAEADGRVVVVKSLRPDLVDDEAFRAMFVDEARLAARLSHPNIVRMHEVGCDGGRWFMALELLEGVSLHRALATLGAGAMPLGARVRVVCDVLAALHHAHELRGDAGEPLRVVHRDVSPSNVFVTFDGRVKLLDFGVAKAKGRANETREGVLKGSVAYMSPDHVCGSTIDRRADVFAAGVILRELLVGRRLWGDDLSEVKIVKRLILGEIPAFPDDAPVPRDLRAICEKAMAPIRSDRYASADEMRAALVVWLEREAPAGTLAELGAALAARVAAGAGGAKKSPREESTAIELSQSALVTDVTPAPQGAPRAVRVPRVAGLGVLAAALAIGAAAGFAALRDVPMPMPMPMPTAEAPSSVVDPEPAQASSAEPAPPAGEAPSARASAASAASADPDAVPDLPPNPYDDVAPPD